MANNHQAILSALDEYKEVFILPGVLLCFKELPTLRAVNEVKMILDNIPLEKE